MSEPRKTPRTQSNTFLAEETSRDDECVYAWFAKALEIETQELAEALGDMVSAYGVFSCGICENARAALLRHRKNQNEVK